MNKTKRIKMVFLIVTIALCVILMLEHLTGPLIHLISGILLVICTGKHTLLRMVRIRKMKLGIRIVDVILLISLVTVTVSGMLLHPLGNLPWILMLHKLSGVVFFLGVIAHVIQHDRRKKRVS